MAIRTSIGNDHAAGLKFVDAVLRLKKAPSRLKPATSSRYDDYVFVHIQSMLMLTVIDPARPIVNGNLKAGGMRMPMPGGMGGMWAHQNPTFLPWHRELLHQLELDLQAVSGDNTVAIPYWDWTVDQDQTKAPWVNDLMGGKGAGVDVPVTTGPFARGQWVLSLNVDDNGKPIGEDFLRRTYQPPKPPGLPTTTEVNSCLGNLVYDAPNWDDDPSLATFRNQLEGYNHAAGRTKGLHNLVHSWVGGTMNSITGSPNDPVFFLHHANVDRLWDQWIKKNPAIKHYLPETLPPGTTWPVTVDKAMTFFDPKVSTAPWAAPPATPRQMLDLATLGYSYA